MNSQSSIHKDRPKEYQDAILYISRFGTSARCLAFRRAWGIPEEGFVDMKAFQAWHKALAIRSNSFVKSKKYRDYEEKVRTKRIEAAEQRSGDFEVNELAYRVWNTVPLNKLESDIDQVMLEENKPEYMRAFIKECLLFKRPRMIGIVRPKPQPELISDPFTGAQKIIIDNVYSDTTTKDFDSPLFTRELKKLQKKISSLRRTRKKRNVELGLQLARLDSETTLSDIEKGDVIFEDQRWNDPKLNPLSLRQIDDLKKNTIRQIRHRSKKG